MSEPVASPTRAEADGEPAASSGRRPSYRPSVRRGLLDLKLWQRFHVRLTLLYGAFVLVALGIMTAAFYRAGVGIALDGVRTRLAGTTVAIARGLDPDELAQLRVPADAAKPAYKGMLDDFTAIDGAESDILSIYVLVPAGQAGMFTFAFDYVSPGKHTAAAASIGQTYDARDNAKLQNGMKEPTVETEISSDEWGESLSGYAPVVDREGKHIALVGVDADAKAIRQMERRILFSAVMLSLLAACLLGVAGFFVGRNVREPLVRVIDAASAISGGNLETRVGLRRQDEFGILGEHFDDMAAGLQDCDRIRTTFGRYVSEDVAKRVLSGTEGARMGGEVREVTVLFSDLRGYSTISEALSPVETVHFLNEYLSVMNDEIDREGGCIIEFLGDAILAVFGAPNDSRRAPRACGAMRDGDALRAREAQRARERRGSRPAVGEGNRGARAAHRNSHGNCRRRELGVEGPREVRGHRRRSERGLAM